MAREVVELDSGSPQEFPQARRVWDLPGKIRESFATIGMVFGMIPTASGGKRRNSRILVPSAKTGDRPFLRQCPGDWQAYRLSPAAIALSQGYCRTTRTVLGSAKRQRPSDVCRLLEAPLLVFLLYRHRKRVGRARQPRLGAWGSGRSSKGRL